MRTSLFTICSLLILGTALPAVAHGVRVEYQMRQLEEVPVQMTDAATMDTPEVAIQAKFASGEPIAHANVEVYAPTQDQQPWLTGQADDAGHFTFEPDAPGEWLIKVHQAGHGAVVRVPIAQLPQPVRAPVTTSDVPTQAPQPIPVTRVAQPHAGGGLPPIQREIGSVLVISGCIGTALYFRSRKH